MVLCFVALVVLFTCKYDMVTLYGEIGYVIFVEIEMKCIISTLYKQHFIIHINHIKAVCYRGEVNCKREVLRKIILKIL